MERRCITARWSVKADAIVSTPISWYSVSSWYVVWQKSNETDFLLTMNLFFLKIKIVPFKIVPFGSYTATEALFSLFVAVLEGFCWYTFQLVSSEISPTRCKNCIFILRNGFTLHVSGDNLTHNQEYICCI